MSLKLAFAVRVSARRNLGEFVQSVWVLNAIEKPRGKAWAHQCEETNRLVYLPKAGIQTAQLNQNSEHTVIAPQRRKGSRNLACLALGAGRKG